MVSGDALRWSWLALAVATALLVGPATRLWMGAGTPWWSPWALWLGLIAVALAVSRLGPSEPR